MLVLAGCAARNTRRGGGIVHVVARGENLYRIGKAYGVDFHELARENRIADPGRIEVGQRIFVPGATRRLPVEIIAPLSATERAPDPRELPVGAARLAWPLRSAVLTSHFGPRGDSFHDGIDLSAAAGAPVFAARGGRVIYSDQIPGYGNIVIVDHGQGFSTVYAHNQSNEVREGDVVERGQLVSRLGSSGRTTGPNLHFEVRVGNVARNPLFFLPPLPGGIGAGAVGGGS